MPHPLALDMLSSLSNKQILFISSRGTPCRSKNLDIKLFKKWKYTDKLCTGCGENEESESELITCKGFGENEKFTYDMLYSDSTQEIVLVAKYLMKRLKVRQK